MTGSIIRTKNMLRTEQCVPVSHWPLHEFLVENEANSYLVVHTVYFGTNIRVSATKRCSRLWKSCSCLICFDFFCLRRRFLVIDFHTHHHRHKMVSPLRRSNPQFEMTINFRNDFIGRTNNRRF